MAIPAKILQQWGLNLKILKRKLVAAGCELLAETPKGTEFFLNSVPYF